jgi:anaerobic selenocysteine-containing dehydrogenase
MKEFITACPRNCYSTCSFRVQVENNTIHRILPFSGNLATPEGPCIKGLSYLERAHTSERIINPMRRSSNGRFTKIKLNEALDLISEKLALIKEKYGSKSILWYRGSGMAGLTNEIGYSFWKLFGGVTITYGNLCWPAGLEAIRLTLGTVKHNVPWDLENARLIIIWGKNPAETNIQEMVFISRAKEKGCKIIVIDPRRTPTADKADILFSPRPGTDAALALSIAFVLIERNLINNSFISKFVLGFEEFKSKSLISPANAEKITGIPSEQIIELALLIGNNSPVTFLPGYGLQRYANGGQTIRAILSLAILTGNLGKSGAGFNYANLQSYIYDNPKEPLSYYPDPLKDIPFRRTISMAKSGTDILNTTDPEIKAAWIERGNPLVQLPDSGSVARALEKMEFRVVVDQFMTDTAAIADLILPAKDMFEQSDIIGSYWSPYIQFKPKVLQPEGEVIAESEIYYHLAARLGLETTDDPIPEPGNENIEKWLDKRISNYSNLRLDDLRKGPVIAPGLQSIAYEDMEFETPSGKIELFSSEAVRKWNISPLPEYVNDKSLNEKQHKFPLVLMTPNTGSRIHSQFGNLETIKQVVDKPMIEISESDAMDRNILFGDKIRVFNELGSLESMAKVTHRIPIGCISMPNGIWLNEGGGINLLIKPEETDIGHGAVFHGNMVEVEKIYES